MKYNRIAIREFIAESFSDQELNTFCQTHFGEVILDFGSRMGRRDKADMLVGYCDRRGVIDSLLEKLETERPNKYGKLKDRLEREEQEDSSRLEEVRTGANEYEEILGRKDRTRILPSQEQAESALAQGSDHPLTGELPEVKHWFLEKLEPDQQVFIVAAALFNGLERKDLMDIYQDMLNILKPANARVQSEV